MNSDYTRAIPTLTEEQWMDIANTIKDREAHPFQRTRASALLLIRDGVDERTIQARTGLTQAEQSDLLRAIETEGIHSIVTSASAAPRRTKYPLNLVAEVLRETIASRPPPGHTKWDLAQLTMIVRQRIPQAETISTERVRGILKDRLGIRSVRQIEPFWLTQVKRKPPIT